MRGHHFGRTTLGGLVSWTRTPLWEDHFGRIGSWTRTPVLQRVKFPRGGAPKGGVSSVVVGARAKWPVIATWVLQGQCDRTRRQRREVRRRKVDSEECRGLGGARRRCGCAGRWSRWRGRCPPTTASHTPHPLVVHEVAHLSSMKSRNRGSCGPLWEDPIWGEVADPFGRTTLGGLVSWTRTPSGHDHKVMSPTRLPVSDENL